MSRDPVNILSNFGLQPAIYAGMTGNDLIKALDLDKPIKSDDTDASTDSDSDDIQSVVDLARKALVNKIESKYEQEQDRPLNNELVDEPVIEDNDEPVIEDNDEPVIDDNDEPVIDDNDEPVIDDNDEPLQEEPLNDKVNQSYHIIMGPTGEVGPKGSDGMDGSDGHIGPTGSEGKMGPTGPTGISAIYNTFRPAVDNKFQIITQGYNFYRVEGNHVMIAGNFTVKALDSMDICVTKVSIPYGTASELTGVCNGFFDNIETSGNAMILTTLNNNKIDFTFGQPLSRNGIIHYSYTIYYTTR